MAKNKQIERYLNIPKNLRKFKEGLNLYLENSINPGLKNKLVIGGDTPNNRALLEAELKKLAEIDPKQIEAEKLKIAEEKKQVAEDVAKKDEEKVKLIEALKSEEENKEIQIAEEKKQYVDLVEKITEASKNKDFDSANENLNALGKILSGDEIGSPTLIAFSTLIEELQKADEAATETKKSDNSKESDNSKKPK